MPAPGQIPAAGDDELEEVRRQLQNLQLEQAAPSGQRDESISMYNELSIKKFAYRSYGTCLFKIQLGVVGPLSLSEESRKQLFESLPFSTHVMDTFSFGKTT